MAHAKLTLSDTDKLQKILRELSLDHFDEKMKFSATMGGGNFIAAGLVTKVATIFYDYEKKYPDTCADHMRIPLLRELLVEYPESIKELEGYGLL